MRIGRQHTVKAENSWWTFGRDEEEEEIDKDGIRTKWHGVEVVEVDVRGEKMTSEVKKYLNPKW